MLKLQIITAIILILTACQSGNGNKEEKQSTEKEKTAKVDIADIEAGIKNWIEAKTKEGDGYFHINTEDQELRLKLVRVHTEYLSNLGPNRHFACVDLADVSGDVYDVDFFMEGDPGAMEVTQTTVHKLNGKPFYTWKQRKDKTWHRVAVEEASNDLLGVVEGTDKFEFYYEAELPEIDKSAKLWLPIAKSDSFQKIELVSIQAPAEHKIISDDEYANSILYLELEPEHSGKTVKLVYEVERKEKAPYAAEKPSEKYLDSTSLLPVNNRFKAIAAEAIGDKRDDSDLMKARALYDYIIDNMHYRKVGEYGTGDAAHACDSKSGNCTEFHSFFISLARSAEIPARFSIGAAIPSERNEGGIDGYHCWAEFYAEGKWWPVDISEGNKYTALATYYFGRHPANRIELSSGRDIEPEIPLASGPINFFAYPVLEIGDVPAAAKTTFSFKRKAVL
ncbi:MAG: transglutaminase domain-containing protein [Chitinophagales bacterium]